MIYFPNYNGVRKFKEELPYNFHSFRPLTLAEPHSHTSAYDNSFIPAAVRNWNLLSASKINQYSNIF